MNTIVMFKKSSFEGVESTNNVKIFSTTKSLEDFQAMFESALKNYVEKIMELNKPMFEACSKLTDVDYGDEMTENMEAFSVLNEKVEEYKESGYIFEFEGQYIDLRKYFWNDSEYYEYGINYLDDWVASKKAEMLIKPKYHSYEVEENEE